MLPPPPLRVQNLAEVIRQLGLADALFDATLPHRNRAQEHMETRGLVRTIAPHDRTLGVLNVGRPAGNVAAAAVLRRVAGGMARTPTQPWEIDGSARSASVEGSR